MVQAIHFAQDLGLFALILEGDSQVVINALNTMDEFLASFGHLLVLKPTINAFNSISVTHTHRLGNFVVHSLTKHAKHIKGMVLETRLGAKPDLPPIPDFFLFLIGLAGFGLFY